MFDNFVEFNSSGAVSDNSYLPHTSCILPHYNRLRIRGNVIMFSLVAGRDKPPSTRSAVSGFSDKSRRRMLSYLDASKAEYKVMVTLTYPHGCGAWNDPERSKDNLRRFIQECQRYSDRMAGGKAAGWSMFWCLEFQKNGSIHYHLLSTHRYPKEWVAGTWFRICGTEEAKHLAAGTRIETIKQGRGGIYAYLAKYTAKKAQKVVPAGMTNPGRFWGVSGERGVVEAATVIIESALPHSMVQNELEILEKMIILGQKKGEVKQIDLPGNPFNAMFVVPRETRQAFRKQIMRIQSAIMLYNGAYGEDFTGEQLEALMDTDDPIFDILG